MKHYYANVPGIGNVALSRHAQDRLAEDGISEREFEAVLLRGDSVPEGQDILWRQKDGIRLYPSQAGTLPRRNPGEDGIPHRAPSQGDLVRVLPSLSKIDPNQYTR